MAKFTLIFVFLVLSFGLNITMAQNKEAISLPEDYCEVPVIFYRESAETYKRKLLKAYDEITFSQDMSSLPDSLKHLYIQDTVGLRQGSINNIEFMIKGRIRRCSRAHKKHKNYSISRENEEYTSADMYLIKVDFIVKVVDNFAEPYGFLISPLVSLYRGESLLIKDLDNLGIKVLKKKICKNCR